MAVSAAGPDRENEKIPPTTTRDASRLSLKHTTPDTEALDQPHEPIAPHRTAFPHLLTRRTVLLIAREPTAQGRSPLCYLGRPPSCRALHRPLGPAPTEEPDIYDGEWEARA